MLDEASLRTTKKPSNDLFLSDLNTMGLSLTYPQGDIGAEDEIERLAKKAERRGMRPARKESPGHVLARIEVISP